VSPVKYELDSYILEDDILHSRRCENFQSYKIFSVTTVDSLGTDTPPVCIHRIFRLVAIITLLSPTPPSGRCLRVYGRSTCIGTMFM
jgi:hypothetical protein